MYLIPAARANGWTASVHSIEVGYPGFVSKATMKLLREFGFSAAEQREMKEELGDTALRCSYFIFSSRHRSQWDNRPLLATNKTQPPDRQAAS